MQPRKVMVIEDALKRKEQGFLFVLKTNQAFAWGVAEVWRMDWVG